MMEIRWVIQNSRPGLEAWHNYNGQSYVGWFYANGIDDGPTDALFEEFSQYADEMPYLDWRIVEERRSYTKKQIRSRYHNAELHPAE